MFPKQLMCVHDAEHDFQNSVFKVIGYFKCEFKFFLVLKFLTSRWSVGRCIWSVVGWSVGRLVGGFKETHASLIHVRTKGGFIIETQVI